MNNIEEPHYSDDVIARRFHDTYERLAPDFGYRTRAESAVPWEDVPDHNRWLTAATVKALIEDGTLVPAARLDAAEAEVERLNDVVSRMDDEVDEHITLAVDSQAETNELQHEIARLTEALTSRTLECDLAWESMRSAEAERDGLAATVDRVRQLCVAKKAEYVAEPPFAMNVRPLTTDDVLAALDPSGEPT